MTPSERSSAYHFRHKAALSRIRSDPNREAKRSRRIAEYAAQLVAEHGMDAEAAKLRARRAYEVQS